MTETFTTPVPGLILSVIMRNEARCIERCLTSVRHWVERIVVLDTGSTDDSVERARRAGAEVHQRPWPDSFAAARNQALDLAGDYRLALVLDADEWLESGGDALHAFASTARDRGDAIGVIRIDSRFDQDGQIRIAPSWLSRVIPAGTRYTGRIHEQVSSPAHRQRLPVVIGHDGYEPAQMAGKQGRNRCLLEAELAAAPNDAYLRYQLGKDAAINGDWAIATASFTAALQWADPSAPWRHDLVVRALNSLRKARQFRSALELVRSEQARWDDSPDFHFTIGDLALDCAVAHPELAESTFFPMIEQHWQRALAIGDRPELDGSVIGHGSHLAAHNLAVFYRCIGDADECRRYEAMAARLREQAVVSLRKPRHPADRR
ncbi:MAG: glycosyltransferase family 2 protein [Burkholderiaceae bacterium]